MATESAATESTTLKLSDDEYRKWAENLIGKDWEIFWQEEEDREEECSNEESKDPSKDEESKDDAHNEDFVPNDIVVPNDAVPNDVVTPDVETGERPRKTVYLEIQPDNTFKQVPAPKET